MMPVNRWPLLFSAPTALAAALLLAACVTGQPLCDREPTRPACTDGSVDAGDAHVGARLGGA